MNAVTRAIAAAFGPVRMARLPEKAVKLADLRAWAKTIAANPEDAATRGAFADWLIERGGHHHEDDLHRLWSHPGPVFATRHPRTKKVVVVPGSRVTEDTLNERRAMMGLAPLRDNVGSAPTVIHGPRGVVVVHGDDTYPYHRATVMQWDHQLHEPTGRLYFDLTDSGGVYNHRTRRRALAVAHAHAFGE